MWKLCKLLISGCFIDCNGSVAMRACDRLCASLRLVEVLICANAVCICVFDEVIRLVTFTFKEDLSCLHIHHFYTLVRIFYKYLERIAQYLRVRLDVDNFCVSIKLVIDQWPHIGHKVTMLFA